MKKENRRKKTIKYISLLLCILIVIQTAVIPSSAKKNRNKPGWKKENGKYYYYFKNREIRDGAVKIKGKNYLLSLDGYKITPKIMQEQLDKARSPKKVMGFGGYKISKKRAANIQSEISKINKAGYDLGFILLDPVSGKGISYNSDGVFYSASSVKGIYIAAIVADNPKILTTDRYDIDAVLKKSDNAAYFRLRRKYGTVPIYKWCEKSDVDPAIGYENFASYSPRQLAKLWSTNLMYFYSGGTGGQLASMYESPNISTIHTTLGTKYRTRTKAGWIGDSKAHSTTDGGIVYKGKKGNRPIIIVINSNIPDNHNMLNNLVYKLNKAHDSMMENEY